MRVTQPTTAGLRCRHHRPAIAACDQRNASFAASANRCSRVRGSAFSNRPPSNSSASISAATAPPAVGGPAKCHVVFFSQLNEIGQPELRSIVAQVFDTQTTTGRDHRVSQILRAMTDVKSGRPPTLRMRASNRSKVRLHKEIAFADDRTVSTAEHLARQSRLEVTSRRRPVIFVAVATRHIKPEPC